LRADWVRVVASSLALIAVLTALATAEASPASWVKNDFYLVDYAHVVYVPNETEAYFEMPINYSDGNLYQAVYVKVVGGKASISGRGNVTVKAILANDTYAYMIVEVVVKYNNITDEVRYMGRDPGAFKDFPWVIPSGIATSYVKEPHSLVKTLVRKDFEEWVRRVYDVDPEDASKAFLSVAAARFIYYTYIRYNASAFPRTLSEVIESRQGDCDDMSRVLMNLLWTYGIPAKIEYGYVYLPIDLPMPVGNSYIYFKDAGPHGYVVAYIPPLGWVSLDLLAGARLIHPVVVTGHSVEADISKEAVEKAEEFNRENLYAELIQLFRVGDEVAAGINASSGNGLRDYAESLLTGYIAILRSRAPKEVALQQTVTITTTVTRTVTQPARTVTVTSTVTRTETVTKTETVKETSVKTVVTTLTSRVTSTKEVTKTEKSTVTTVKYVGGGVWVITTLVSTAAALASLAALIIIGVRRSSARQA